MAFAPLIMRLKSCNLLNELQQGSVRERLQSRQHLSSSIAQMVCHGLDALNHLASTIHPSHSSLHQPMQTWQYVFVMALCDRIVSRSHCRSTCTLSADQLRLKASPKADDTQKMGGPWPYMKEPCTNTSNIVSADTSRWGSCIADEEVLCFMCFIAAFCVLRNKCNWRHS